MTTLDDINAVLVELKEKLPNLVRRDELQDIVDKTGATLHVQNAAIADLILKFDTLNKQVAALSAHAALSGFDVCSSEGLPN